MGDSGTVAAHGVPRDRALVSLAADGDREAYEALIEARLPLLYRTALGILRHEADARDAVQDSCVAAWQQLRRLRDPDRFDAWLARILVNACRGRLRTRRTAHVREIDLAIVREADRPTTGDQALADRVAEIDAVRGAFMRLRPEQRVILALHHADRRPIAEIAEILHIPEGTVKWRLHAARQALAAALERDR
jgi:RNA polymerase sigma-70 factor (ECF subfamily)